MTALNKFAAITQREASISMASDGSKSNQTNDVSCRHARVVMWSGTGCWMQDEPRIACSACCGTAQARRKLAQRQKRMWARQVENQLNPPRRNQQQSRMLDRRLVFVEHLTPQASCALLQSRPGSPRETSRDRQEYDRYLVWSRVTCLPSRRMTCTRRRRVEGLSSVLIDRLSAATTRSTV